MAIRLIGKAAEAAKQIVTLLSNGKRIKEQIEEHIRQHATELFDSESDFMTQYALNGSHDPADKVRADAANQMAYAIRTARQQMLNELESQLAPQIVELWKQICPNGDETLYALMVDSEGVAHLVDRDQVNHMTTSGSIH